MLEDGDNESNITKIITSFLGKIPQDLLAKASYHCQAYTRALMHMELYLRGGKNELQTQLGFLQVCGTERVCYGPLKTGFSSTH